MERYRTRGQGRGRGGCKGSPIQSHIEKGGEKRFQREKEQREGRRRETETQERETASAKKERELSVLLPRVRESQRSSAPPRWPGQRTAVPALLAPPDS